MNEDLKTILEATAYIKRMYPQSGVAWLKADEIEKCAKRMQEKCKNF